MGVGTFFRYLGSALLLTATALLIVADVSAPVVNQLAIFRVEVGGRDADDGGAEINFGSFGWCVRADGIDDRCSKSHIGYNAARVIRGVDGTRFSNAAENTIEALTNVMVLHAVATGIFFIAFLLSLGKGVLISLMATAITALGFLITAVAVICDFVGFSIIRRRVRRDSDNSSAHYGPAAWCILAAAVLSLIATVLVFITCCAGRRERSHHHRNRKAEAYDGPVTAAPRRRRFWQRRAAY